MGGGIGFFVAGGHAYMIEPAGGLQFPCNGARSFSRGFLYSIGGLVAGMAWPVTVPLFVSFDFLKNGK